MRKAFRASTSRSILLNLKFHRGNFQKEYPPQNHIHMTKLLLSIMSSSFVLILVSCHDQENACASKGKVLDSFVTSEGTEVYIFEDGNAYTLSHGSCNFLGQYFDPNFLSNNYAISTNKVELITEDGLLSIKNEYTENFETYLSFEKLFLRDITETQLYWTSFVLQSPESPTINDYVALRKCILEATCSFLDNRIELATDPINLTNQVLRFTSVPPSSNMVTAKSSIESSISFFRKGDELWFQADYYIESGTPFSIVDFENSYFLESPGPRVVIRNNELSVENKFGKKKEYFQNVPAKLPSNSWVTIKVHFQFSDNENGVIELWQDGTKIISETGVNLPTENSVQNTIEIGITATSVATVLLVDNVTISSSAF